MKKIDSVKKLPDWFKIEKYENTRGFGPKDWYRELSFRLYMQNALKSIQKQSDEFISINFQKTLLFCFKELALNPTDTSSATKRIDNYFQTILKNYREYKEPSERSTLAQYKSALSKNQKNVPEKVDTFLKKYELNLPLQLKKPINQLHPHGLKTLSEIFNKIHYEWCSKKLNEFGELESNIDADEVAKTLSNILHKFSVTSFIRDELKSADPKGKLEKELQIAGINTTDEIIIVDLLNDDAVLVSQFKEIVKKLKAERKINNKVLKASENKLAKLNNFKVLPYIDLIFWGEFNKSPICKDLLDATLFPLGGLTTDHSENFMTEALSISFLQSMENN